MSKPNDLKKRKEKTTNSGTRKHFFNLSQQLDQNQEKKRSENRQKKRLETAQEILRISF